MIVVTHRGRREEEERETQQSEVDSDDLAGEDG